jgi:hypothetical protein
MIFKKNGRLYGNIESLLNECCEINQYCFQCALHGKIGTKSCAGYAAENPEEVARLLDATVIKDRPITAKAAEGNREDAKRKLTRADILHAAEKCVCGQRETDYGTPEDNFETIAEFWTAYLSRACVDEAGGVYIDANDVAMMMALLKIACIARGGGKADNWIDLAGYAACGAECEGVTE